jgi:hypothetical protein
MMMAQVGYMHPAVHTAGGGKGYICTAGGGDILHVHNARPDDGYTLHVYNARAVDGYTLHVHNAGDGNKDILHVYSAGGGKGIHPAQCTSTL